MTFVFDSQTQSASPAPFDPISTHALSDWDHHSKLLCCRVDPRGRYVAAGAIDHTIACWEISSGEKKVLAGHENWVRSLVFSPDGATLYSGGYDGRLIIWDLAAQTPHPRRTIQTDHGWVRGVAVSHDGERIATVGNDSAVRVWAAGDGELVYACQGHPQISYCVAFVPGSHDLLSGDVIGNIHHWGGADGKLLRKLDGMEIHNMIGDIAPFGGIIHLAFSPDMLRLTACGLHKTSNAPAGNRRAVALSFDWKTGTKLPKQESIAKEFDATMWRVQYHSGGVMLGVVAKGIGFWRDGQEELFHLLETPSEVFDFDLHPNQVDLYTAHFDGHVRSWRCAKA